MKFLLLFILALTAKAQEEAEEEEACDNTNEQDNYRIEETGQSTQFKIYDLCDNRFVKIKMEELTEIDADGKKTGNKEVSFASAKGWEFGENGGYREDPCPIGLEGGACIYNNYTADPLTKVDASFVLETWFAVEPLIVEIPVEGGEEGEVANYTVAQATIKMSATITRWPLLNSANTLQLCIGIMTNKAGAFNVEDDGRLYVLEMAEIDNLDVASCDDGNGIQTIDVGIEQNTNGNNHLDICYNFGACASAEDVANIEYDPFITMTDGGSVRSVIALFSAVFIITLYV